MGKIKIKRAIWGFNPGQIVTVSNEAEVFAVRKGVAEPVPEHIEPAIPDVKPDVKQKLDKVKPRRAPQNKAETARSNKTLMPDNI